MAEQIGLRTWTLDKAPLGPGPWESESDKATWVDAATDLDCMIRRGPLGAWCGYVGVTAGHPYFEAPQWDLPSPDVHGGLSYAAFCEEGEPEATGICHLPLPGRDPHVWWLGFDCSHYQDLVPLRPWPELGQRSLVYRDEAYVRGEVLQLAAQLAAVPRG